LGKTQKELSAFIQEVNKSAHVSSKLFIITTPTTAIHSQPGSSRYLTRSRSHRHRFSLRSSPATAHQGFRARRPPRGALSSPRAAGRNRKAAAEPGLQVWTSPPPLAKLGIAEHPPSNLGSRGSRGNTGNLQEYRGGSTRVAKGFLSCCAIIRTASSRRRPPPPQLAVPHRRRPHLRAPGQGKLDLCSARFFPC
jgi:hypothetical protein